MNSFYSSIEQQENPALRNRPAAGYWDNGFPEHIPYPFKCIEWLEIDPVVRVRLGRLVDDDTIGFTDEVVQALQSKHVPFRLEGGIIRVQAYSRPTPVEHVSTSTVHRGDR